MREAIIALAIGLAIIALAGLPSPLALWAIERAAG